MPSFVIFCLTACCGTPILSIFRYGWYLGSSCMAEVDEGADDEEDVKIEARGDGPATLGFGKSRLNVTILDPTENSADV